MSELSIRHRKFVEAVLNGKTLISAYYEAGYKAEKEVSAYTNASVLLRNAKIQAYIKERLAEQEAVDRMRLDRLRSDAIIQLQKLIREGLPENKVQLDAVKDTLDRTGFKPIDKQEMDVNANVGITLGDVINRARKKKDEPSNT